MAAADCRGFSSQFPIVGYLKSGEFSQNFGFILSEIVFSTPTSSTKDQHKMGDDEELESDLPEESMLPPSSGPIRRTPVRLQKQPYHRRQRHTPSRTRFTPQRSPPGLSYVSLPAFTGSISSLDDLSPAQVKQLQKQYQDTEDHVDFVADVCSRLYGESPDRMMLIATIAEILNATPDIRPFSALTVKDYESLNKGAKAMIKVDEQELLKKVPLESVPEWFWSSQKSYRSCLSRRMEMGVRNIIGNILIAAVEIARGLFDNPRLTLHSEWEVPVTDVPGIGKVYGPVDFVTAPVSGGVDMGMKHTRTG